LKIYEFKEIKSSSGGLYTISVTDLNKFGKAGWALVCFTDEGKTAIMQREIVAMKFSEPQPMSDTMRLMGY